MNTDMTPVQVGTRVNYHGSVEELHGDYVVMAHTEPRGYPSAYVVDGTAYTLWDAATWEAARGLGDGQALYNARRTSFTVIEEPTDA